MLFKKSTVFLVVIGLIAFFGCSEEGSKAAPKKQAVVGGSDATAQQTTAETSNQLPTNTGTTTGTSTITDTGTATGGVTESTSGRNPIILITGWGHKLPGNSTQPIVDRIIADGAGDAYNVEYSDHSDPDTVSKEIATTIQTIFAKYPAGTKFDMWGLSTGHFVGLYAMMTNNLDNRFQRFIGFFGIAHGMDAFYLPIIGEALGIKFNESITGYSLVVGKTLTEISPSYRTGTNQFLNAFYSKYDSRIKALDKCSIFSPADGLVTPYDSGSFPDGRNYSIPNLKHMDGIKKPDHYNALVKNCYGSLWPKQYP